MDPHARSSTTEPPSGPDNVGPGDSPNATESPRKTGWEPCRVYPLRARLFLGAVTACVLAVVYTCDKGPAAHTASVQPDAQRPRTVKLDKDTVTRTGIRVQPAGSHRVPQHIQVPGSLDYDVERVAKIGTIIEGRVTSVTVKVGDRVAKGQRVVSLSAPTVASAQADYLSSKADLAFGRDQLAREQKLAANNLTTAQELERARSQHAKAEAHLSAAQAKLSALRVGIPADKDGVGASGRIDLVSPIDGVVVERSVVVGEYLVPQETALVVADVSELWAMLNVFEADLGYMQRNTEVTLSIDALPGRRFVGRLTALEPQLAQASRTARARVVVLNPDGSLRPGLFVRASIPIAEEAGTVVVPIAAVQPVDDGDAVFVERAPGYYEVRPVRVAHRTLELAQLSEGISRDEPIVVEGGFLLRGELTRQ